MELFLHNEQLLAVVHQVETAGATYDRSSKLSSWTRFRTDRQLTEMVNDRYPGLGFRGFEILERGVSGRVGRMKILGDGGRSEVVEGLAVRWTLDVPDTLFTAKRLTPPDKSPGWLFTGRGWGHGVGMCQIGAFGMAIRGHSYQDILKHYYTGIGIVSTSPSGAVRP
jgi:stage II sporulation protein D